MDAPDVGYHPLVVQLWKEVLGTSNQRFVLPMEIEKAAEIAIRKLPDIPDLDWANVSLLNAAVLAQDLVAEQVKAALVRLSQFTEAVLELRREELDSFAIAKDSAAERKLPRAFGEARQDGIPIATLEVSRPRRA